MKINHCKHLYFWKAPCYLFVFSFDVTTNIGGLLTPCEYNVKVLNKVVYLP